MTATTNRYSITVHYDRMLDDSAGGCVRIAYSRIASLAVFERSAGSMVLTPEFVTLNRKINSTGALMNLAFEGLRIGTIEEFLAIGKQHPKLQVEFPIVIVEHHRRGAYFAALLDHTVEEGRILRTVEYKIVTDDRHNWPENCRFLAFPEDSHSPVW